MEKLRSITERIDYVDRAIINILLAVGVIAALLYWLSAFVNLEEVFLGFVLGCVFFFAVIVLKIMRDFSTAAVLVPVIIASLFGTYYLSTLPKFNGWVIWIVFVLSIAINIFDHSFDVLI